MNFRIVLAACVALTVACRISHAQVDASLLRPGVDSLAYYVVDSDTIRRGTLRQELGVHQSDDQRRVVLVSERRIAGREPSVDTMILAFDGLQTIRRRISGRPTGLRSCRAGRRRHCIPTISTSNLFGSLGPTALRLDSSTPRRAD